ncbi:sugar ABC transporter ATP-binding protein [Rhodococcus sp. NPDC057014]|uniref:sugar ABC transporter ATP-binding protein n=1 Tax=Rhodococcus sp. NPDC057014 TaxID=3346000 RepID=UPI003636C69A
MPPAVRAVGLGKRYGNFAALDDISLEIRRGEVIGLVGENGAGKSTLLSLLSGSEQPDAGQVEISGAPVRLNSYVEANRHGVFRAQQDQGLLPNLTVAENLFFGHEGRLSRFGLLDRRAIRALTEEAIVNDPYLNGEVSADSKVGSLPLNLRQLVEISRCFAVARLLGIDHPVVFLDETTASLNFDEVNELFEYINSRRGSASFVFVSHRIQEVLELCDRLYVLKDGRLVSEHSSSKVTESQIHHAMVGREQEYTYGLTEDRQPPTDEVVLELDGLTSATGVQDVHLSLRSGEVVCVGGVTGSGKSELARAVAGDLPITGGHLYVRGRRIARSGARSRRGSVAYGPLDRHGEGVVLGHSVSWNVTMGSLHRLRSRFSRWIDKQRESDFVTAAIEDYSIATTTPRKLVGQLSGGNQQKVMIARIASDESPVLVVDNPTRGVDGRSREDIYRILRSEAGKGKAVLIVSDDLREIIGMGDRILVMKDGAVAHEWNCSLGRPSEAELVSRMV